MAYKTLGIIAEYDPFHNGHKAMLEKAKLESGSDFVICVVSGPFLQRGIPSMFSVNDRAKMALLGGADIVLSMPYSFSCAPAHRFALGGVSILSSVKVVDTLAYGVEAEHLDLFNKAKLKYPKSFNQKVEKGESLAKKASSLMGLSENGLNSPNLSLALCYEDAIKKLGSLFKSIQIPRYNGYHDKELSSIASAAAVRRAIRNGSWAEAKEGLPEESYNIVKNSVFCGRCFKKDALDKVLLSKLIFTDKEGLKNTPELIEGLDNKLFSNIRSAKSRQDLILSLKSKRYTYTRLSRGLWNALFSLKEENLEATPSYARLVGFRQRALPILRQIKKSGFPILNSLSDIKKADFKTDVISEELWWLGTSCSPSSAYFEQIVKL